MGGRGLGEKEKETIDVFATAAGMYGQVSCDREVVAAHKVTEATRCSKQITRSEAA